MFSIFETIAKLASRTAKSDACLGEPSATAPDLAPGTPWKHYIIRDSLGKGHFGTVYQAYDSHLNREVALKFLNNTQAMQEGKVLARIHHEGVVKVYSVEEGDGLTATCMELVQGVNLESYLVRKGRLDAMHAAVVGRRLSSALATVHRAGLLHRDIKTQNVIMAGDARIVFVDFGLGIPIDNGVRDFAGTLPYMAPELFEGEVASRSSDLYALGVLLFHLVSSEYPVIADSVEAFRRLHRNGSRLHLADCVSVPESFERLIERATSPNPADRFQSAGAMATALDEVIRNRPRQSWRLLQGKAVWAGLGLAAAVITVWALRDRFSALPEATLQLLDSQIGVYDEPSLSADGRILVFTSDKAGNGDMDVWVKYVNTGSSKALTGPGADEVEPAVSADGTMVAYRSERDGGLYLNSTLGGEERRLVVGGRHPRFSPDGHRLAYWTGEEGNLQTASARTYVVNVEGGQPIQVLPGFADSRFPVWSPDGKYLLVTATRDRDTTPRQGMDWWLVPIDQKGSPVKMEFYSRMRALNVQPAEYPPHWSGSRIVLAARQGETANIWQVSVAEGHITDQPKPLTSGTAMEGSPWSLSDGTVAFAVRNPRINVWSLPLGISKSNLTRETSAVNFDLTPHVSSDGRVLLFVRVQGSVFWTWIRDRSTGAERRLPLPDHATPLLSQDGTSIVYSIENAGRHPLFEYKLDLAATRALCEDCGPPLDWSRDGTHVLYKNSRTEEIDVLNLSTGSRTALVRNPGHSYIAAALSPSQDRLAFVEGIDSEHFRIQVTRLENGTPEPIEKWIDVTTSRGLNDKPTWSADGSTLYYRSTKDGFGCIWAQGLDANNRLTSAPVAVLHLHAARLTTLEIAQPSLGLAIGGGSLFINLDETTGTLWLRRPRVAGISPRSQFQN